jgi:hypothetical protein
MAPTSTADGTMLAVDRHAEDHDVGAARPQPDDGRRVHPTDGGGAQRQRPNLAQSESLSLSADNHLNVLKAQ